MNTFYILCRIHLIVCLVMLRMKIKAVSFLLLMLLSLCSAEDVTVTVQGVTTIGTTDDNFVCATLDWWPVNKCDYNQCPWGKAGILNLVISLHLLSQFYCIFIMYY